MMDGPGFHAEIGVLDAAADAISASVSDQRGTALDKVDRAAGTYGHDGLHSALERFCDRWNDGFDILLKDAETIGGLLGEVANAYREADAASAGRLGSDPARQVVDD